MTLNEIIKVIQDLGIFGVLLIILWGGHKGWWVFGWTFNDLNSRHETLRQEKNEWKELALHSTNLAETLNEMRQHGWKGPS